MVRVWREVEVVDMGADGRGREGDGDGKRRWGWR